MPKHDVLTVKLTFHIAVDLNDPDSVRAATSLANDLLKNAKGFSQASMQTRFGRVPAPEPEPETHGIMTGTDQEPPDNLDLPDNLRRTAKTAAAEA